MPKKICSHSQLSPLDEFLYGKKICIECRREKGRRHYQRNKEKILAKAAEYRKNNPERVKEFKKKYYDKVRSVSLVKGKTRKLTKEEMFYVNKLKSIIYKIHQIERRHRKYCGLAQCRNQKA